MLLEAKLQDITKVESDVIVNSANSYLRHGGGVAKAIADSAGEELQRESEQAQFVSTGDACFTSAGRLAAKWVVHAVGPVWHGGNDHEASDLANAYRSSLRVAAKLGATSVAFPSISTGIYEFPVEQAAQIVVGAILSEVKVLDHKFEAICFCLFSERDLAIYQRAIASITN